MRNFINIFIIILCLISISAIFGCNQLLRTGYLRKDIHINNHNGDLAVEIYQGSFVNSGSVVVWADSLGNLYRESAKRLLYGKVSDSSILKYTNKNENGLKEAKVNVHVSPMLLTNDMKDITAESENIYYEYCSTCHSAPDLTKMFNKQMKGVMQSMVSHSNIPPKEAEQLRRYINLTISN